MLGNVIQILLIFFNYLHSLLFPYNVVKLTDFIKFHDFPVTGKHDLTFPLLSSVNGTLKVQLP